MSTYRLIVSTPEGQIFSEQVQELSVRAAEGDMAVLAGHVPLMTTLKPCICRIVLQDGKRRSGKLDRGFLTVGKDEVILLSSAFEWVEES